MTLSCRDAMRALLVAEPSELMGRGEGDLAAHLHRCGSCRAMAETVLRNEGALARELTSAVAAPDLEVLLHEALRTSHRRLIIGRRVRGFRKMALGLLPAAAAAALLLFFSHRPSTLPGVPYRPRIELPAVEVEVGEGQQVAVLNTGDPHITVLWFF